VNCVFITQFSKNTISISDRQREDKTATAVTAVSLILRKQLRMPAAAIVVELIGQRITSQSSAL